MNNLKSYKELFTGPYMLDLSMFADPWYGVPIVHSLGYWKELVFLPTFVVRLAEYYSQREEGEECAIDILRDVLAEYLGISKEIIPEWYVKHLLNVFWKHKNLAFKYVFDIQRDIDPLFQHREYVKVLKKEIMKRLEELEYSREGLRFFFEGVEELHPYVATIVLEELFFLLKHSSVAALKDSLIRYGRRLGFAVLRLAEKYKKFVDAKKSFLRKTGLEYVKLPLKLISFMILPIGMEPGVNVILTVIEDP